MTLKMIAMVAAFSVLVQGPALAFGKKKSAPEETRTEAVKTEEGAPAVMADDDYRSPRVRALDTNKDDKITQEEFLKEHLAQFSAMDANQDKTLSPDEVDFPPNTPEDRKVMMRKHMQEEEIRMEQRRIDDEKRRAEDEKRRAEEMKAMEAAREAEMKARKLEEEKAAKTPVPAETPVPTQNPAEPAAQTTVKPEAAPAVPSGSGAPAAATPDPAAAPQPKAAP